MTNKDIKTLEEIQQENRKMILEAIHGCSYDEALEKEEEIEFANSFFCPSGVLIKEYVRPENYLKGLGKPITLSRVLLALDKSESGTNYLLNTNGKFYENGLVKNCNSVDGYRYESFLEWNLQKETLEEQTPEVQIAINKLLKGGNNDK